MTGYVADDPLVDADGKLTLRYHGRLHHIGIGIGIGIGRTPPGTPRRRKHPNPDQGLGVSSMSRDITLARSEGVEPPAF